MDFTSIQRVTEGQLSTSHILFNSKAIISAQKQSEGASSVGEKV